MTQGRHVKSCTEPRGGAFFVFFFFCLSRESAFKASYRVLLYCIIVLCRDLRTSGWINLFLVTVAFLLLDPLLVVLPVAVSTEPVVSITLLLKFGLSVAIKVQKEGGNVIIRDPGSVNILVLG